jgi:hypothetical protein
MTVEVLTPQTLAVSCISMPVTAISIIDFLQKSCLGESFHHVNLTLQPITQNRPQKNLNCSLYHGNAFARVLIFSFTY